MANTLHRVTRTLRDLIRLRPAASSRQRSAPEQVSPGQAAPERHGDYPGDATAVPDTTYAPKPDGRPDPGEIVWTWVPYEEDETQGKDRPVLVIGREEPWLIGLQLTSKDHDRDEEQERRAGREWVDIGSGPWDGRGRPSEVRTNRLLRVDPAAVRREGAVLTRERYAAVVAAARPGRPRG